MAGQAIRVAPRVDLSASRAAYVGPGLDLAPHRNAVATIAFALDAPFELRLYAPPTASGGVESRRAAVIPPGVRHHLRARGPMAFIYLDALSDDYAAAHPERWASAYPTVVQAAATGAAVDAMCRVIGLPQRDLSRSPLLKTIRAIDRCPQRFRTVEDAARHSGRSTSRFQYLFRCETGLPFRRYRLWRRMAVVAEVLRRRDTLTQAAFEAGFASSAHLSTAFKAMFGLRPSDLVKMNVSFHLDTTTDRTA